MAEHLQADPHGLRLSAANSRGIAAALVTSATNVGDDQPSHAGVGAVDAAVKAVRDRQARRVGCQADDVQAGGIAYDRTDGHAAGTIAEAM